VCHTPFSLVFQVADIHESSSFVFCMHFLCAQTITYLSSRNLLDFNKQPTNSTGQNTSWETFEEISHTWWNMKFCYCFCNKLSLVSSLTQMNPIRSIPSFFLKIHFNILIYAKILQATSSLVVFLSNFCMHFSFSHACHMPCSSDLPCFDHPSNIRWEVKILKLLIT